MSYFVCGYSRHSSFISNLCNHIEFVTPHAIRNNKKEFAEEKTFIRIFGYKKAINDFFYCNQITGSWIAIIGTPLISGTSEEEKEGILNSFLNNPEAFVKKLIDGCWCLFAYDSPNDNFYACTDFENTIPIYYSIKDSSIYFSSHELPLAKFLGCEIDPIGFSMAIHLKLTWGTHTRFKNIHKMLPAQLIIFNNQKGALRFQYWKPSEEKLLNITFNETIDYFLDILNNSVQLFYKYSINKTAFCDITGGEDSRLVLSSARHLEIPFVGLVDGNQSDLDVIIANKLAKAGGFKLIVRPTPKITEQIILDAAINSVLFVDGYEDYMLSFVLYLINSVEPNISYTHIKYGGAPGGEVFRGSYYLRGKAFFPSSYHRFDHVFFTRMKFLLDFMPGLLKSQDEDFTTLLMNMIKESLQEVSDFPVGTKIDHVLRLFQTCNTGLIYKTPRYLPLATRELTKAIYKIPPKYKRGGRLTKACTELMFPEIAMVKTQKGVPTIRKNIYRVFKFFPEYTWIVKHISSGLISRLLKWRDSNKPSLSWEKTSDIIRTLLIKPPYCLWFSSPKTMITGNQYKFEALKNILTSAKEKKYYNVVTLGRIIFQEIAVRWVYDELKI